MQTAGSWARLCNVHVYKGPEIRCSYSFALARGPAPSSTRFRSPFRLFKGMVLDGRGLNGSRQEDGSGMFVAWFTAISALSFSLQDAVLHPEPTMCPSICKPTLMTHA